MKSLIKGCANSAFTWSMPRSLCIGAVCHHQENTLLAQLRETAEIRHLAVNRGIVQLKVTSMNNGAHRGINSQTYSIRNTVVHTNKVYVETACSNSISLHDSP